MIISSPADAIPETLLTTQGDMVVRGAAAAEALAVGANLTILSSDGTDPQWLAPAVQVQIASGNYVGNNAASRQITVGFKPSLVIIEMEADRNAVLGPGARKVAHGDSAPFHGTLNSALHASDGFTVTSTVIAAWTNATSNLTGVTYYYWAISE